MSTSPQIQPVAQPLEASARRLTTIRWVVGAWCAAFVLAMVAIHTLRVLHRHGEIATVRGFLSDQVATLGLAALALALLTLPLGLFYGRGFAGRFGFAPQMRAAHMTISLAALVTIVLHMITLGARTVASLGGIKPLVVPFVWTDDNRFPYPTAAGIVAFWLVIFFGLSYFMRGRIGGQRPWRIAHHTVILALALSLLHAVYLSGRLKGWG